MVSDKQIFEVLIKIRENVPEDFFSKVNEEYRGMSFILNYLNEKTDGYANAIADKLGVSRARIAKLINKLEVKGLITKTPSSTDGRIDVLKLTSKGVAELKRIRENLISTTGSIIEEVGMEDIEKLISILGAIKKVLEQIKK